MHFSRNQESCILKSNHCSGQQGLWSVRPCMELLAEHDTTEEDCREHILRCTGWKAPQNCDGEEDGTGQGMQVVGKLPLGDGPRSPVVPLKCINLGTKDGGRGVPVVVPARQSKESSTARLALRCLTSSESSTWCPVLRFLTPSEP